MQGVDTSRPTTRIYHIGEASRQLSVSPEHLRTLEREGRIPPARRDFNGRIYSDLDLALLRVMGVGRRPRKLKRAEEVLEVAG
jgi:DNA-binding transcriptional MerR regulator